MAAFVKEINIINSFLINESYQRSNYSKMKKKINIKDIGRTGPEKDNSNTSGIH